MFGLIFDAESIPRRGFLRMRQDAAIASAVESLSLSRPRFRRGLVPAEQQLAGTACHLSNLSVLCVVARSNF